MELGDGIKKFFLLGVGATAATIEKSTEIVDDLVKKGELTVEQGKVFNQELKRTMKETAETAQAAGAAAAASVQSAAAAAQAAGTPEQEPAAAAKEAPKDFGSFVSGLSAEELAALKEEIAKAEG